MLPSSTSATGVADSLTTGSASTGSVFSCCVTPGNMSDTHIVVSAMDNIIIKNFFFR